MTLPGQFVDPNPPASLAAATARANNAFLFCLEVTCGIRMASWFPITGNAYMHPLGDFSGVFNDSVDLITAVYVNGVALAPAASVLAVSTNPGTFFWDGVANQALVISMPDNSNPQARGVVVEAVATYYFSDGPNDTGGIRWRPWLLTPGTLDKRVTPDFSSISQIGNGSFVLQNENHFFDTRREQNWDAGSAVLSVIPAGTAGAPTVLGTFQVGSTKLTEKNFTLQVQDPKVLADTYFPIDLFGSGSFGFGTYPNMDPSIVGQVVPQAYGPINDVTPYCVDTVNGIFVVARHAITNFVGVRVYDSSLGAWNYVNFYAPGTNPATATFQLSLSDWQKGDTVAVDFIGKPLANGWGMINPADIIQDIFTELGLPTNAAGFTAAHNRYDVGFYGNNVNDRRVSMGPAVYITDRQTALDTIEKICVNIRAYIQTAPDGSFTLTPFRTYAVDNLLTLTDENTLEPGIAIDGSGTTSQWIVAGSKATQAQITWGTKKNLNTVQTVTVESTFNKNTRLYSTDVVEAIDTLFVTEPDATYLAQAQVNEYRVDPAVWTVSLKWYAWTLVPGVHVRCYFPRHCIDMLCEVLGIKFDIGKRRCTLTLGNPRGFDNTGTTWGTSTDTTPLGAATAWPQTGEADAPNARDQRWRRFHCAHWCGSDGFAVNTASPLATSNAWSDLDKSVSLWG